MHEKIYFEKSPAEHCEFKISYDRPGTWSRGFSCPVIHTTGKTFPKRTTRAKVCSSHCCKVDKIPRKGLTE